MVTSTATIKLNLGCGATVVDGWTNVDYGLGARVNRVPVVGFLSRRLGIFKTPWDPAVFIHDLRKKFPWEDGSVTAVYSSHFLEHLTREDGRRFLQECIRVLAPGGTVRIVVPDLRVLVGRYLEGRFPADAFVDKLGVLYTEKGGPVRSRLAPLFQFPHRCMYDPATLIAIFREFGLDAVAKEPFDSAISDIRTIEHEARARGSVIVEGTR